MLVFVLLPAVVRHRESDWQPGHLRLQPDELVLVGRPDGVVARAGERGGGRLGHRRRRGLPPSEGIRLAAGNQFAGDEIDGRRAASEGLVHDLNRHKQIGKQRREEVVY